MQTIHASRSRSYAFSFSFFSCGHATLKEALSVQPFVGPSVGPSVRRGDRVEKWENERFRSFLCTAGPRDNGFKGTGYF